MDLRLEGKVAVVTGGSRGIGLATARTMAEAGARVMITSRKADVLKAAVEQIPGEAAFFAANAGEPEQAAACVAETMKRYGSIDILVNNAGTNPYFGSLAAIGGYAVEPGIGWYNVTKAAVIHLTRQLAGELGPRVRVNAIAPGLVRTDLARALWEPAEEAVSRRLPLRRIGEPVDIANAALFLASDAASWITGQTLVVDGGAMVAPGGGVSP